MVGRAYKIELNKNFRKMLHTHRSLYELGNGHIHSTWNLCLLVAWVAQTCPYLISIHLFRMVDDKIRKINNLFRFDCNLLKKYIFPSKLRDIENLAFRGIYEQNKKIGKVLCFLQQRQTDTRHIRHTQNSLQCDKFAVKTFKVRANAESDKFNVCRDRRERERVETGEFLWWIFWHHSFFIIFTCNSMQLSSNSSIKRTEFSSFPILISSSESAFSDLEHTDWLNV